ncbi:hypothetical protein EJ08DRAFT_599528 [Tothia fuscella]|uniref:Uncharacterized protein n=1 Tax=Tothia fuscella TaxID=1048955 RepID=A0A9P4NF09_9PEZI|nr:hypothetical protein EJ08DRAFT_599528 [Tothia fuscella]
MDNKAVVHATFQALCKANLGSQDYYALCSKANMVYLSDIPHFKFDELDFVRRFITLIDLAYESKTRIVCLAAVPLTELFSNILTTSETAALQNAIGDMSVKKEGGSSSSAGETDVRFAVARAVSRLVEMGSNNYGNSD